LLQLRDHSRQSESCIHRESRRAKEIDFEEATTIEGIAAKERSAETERGKWREIVGPIPAEEEHSGYDNQGEGEAGGGQDQGIDERCGLQIPSAGGAREAAAGRTEAL